MSTALNQTPARIATVAPALNPIAPSAVARVLEISCEMETTRQNFERVCDVIDAFGPQLSDPVLQTLEADADKLEAKLAVLEARQSEAMADFERELASIALRFARRSVIEH